MYPTLFGEQGYIHRLKGFYTNLKFVLKSSLSPFNKYTKVKHFECNAFTLLWNHKIRQRTTSNCGLPVSFINQVSTSDDNWFLKSFHSFQQLLPPPFNFVSGWWAEDYRGSRIIKIFILLSKKAMHRCPSPSGHSHIQWKHYSKETMRISKHSHINTDFIFIKLELEITQLAL